MIINPKDGPMFVAIFAIIVIVGVVAIYLTK